MLASKYESVERLRMTQICGKRKAESVYAKNGLIVVGLGKGKWWSNVPRFNKGCYVGDHSSFFKLLRGLAAIGVLPSKDVEAHINENALSTADRRKMWDMDTLKEITKKYGLVVKKKGN